MPIGMASVLVGLFAAAALYAKWCGGATGAMSGLQFGLLMGVFTAAALYAKWCGGATGAMSGLQFGLLMGVFTACVHALSNLVTMNMHPKLGLEIAVSTFFGWLLAGITIGLVYKPK
jgi:hypothetical protein